MKVKLAALVLGTAFGFWLSWSGLTRYDVILGGLTFADWHLWRVFVGGVVASTIGLWLLRASGARTLVGREPVTWSRGRPTRSMLVGAALFGIGWAVAGTCPGPAIAQLGTGQLAGLFTCAGIFAGVLLRGRVAPGDLGPDSVCADPVSAPVTEGRPRQ